MRGRFGVVVVFALLSCGTFLSAPLRVADAAIYREWTGVKSCSAATAEAGWSVEGDVSSSVCDTDQNNYIYHYLGNKDSHVDTSRLTFSGFPFSSADLPPAAALLNFQPSLTGGLYYDDHQHGTWKTIRLKIGSATAGADQVTSLKWTNNSWVTLTPSGFFGYASRSKTGANLITYSGFDFIGGSEFYSEGNTEDWIYQTLARLRVQWEIVAVVHSVSPASIPVGSAPVLMRVKGLVYDKKDSWTPQCRFNGVETSATIVNETDITCSITPSTVGTFPLEIALDGSVYTTNDIQVSVFPPTTGVPTNGIPSTSSVTAVVSATVASSSSSIVSGSPSASSQSSSTAISAQVSTGSSTTGNSVAIDAADSASSSAGTTTLIIIIACAVGGCLLLSLCLFCVVRSRKRSTGNQDQEGSDDSAEVVVYDNVGAIKDNGSASSGSVEEVVYGDLNQFQEY